MKLPILTLILVLILQGCNQSSKISYDDLNNISSNPISVSGTRFTDSYGRQVIFNGINKVNKDPMMNYTDKDSLESYKQLHQWGFNCIRLGVIWDGVEHEPGNYDSKYLDKIEERINWAAQNGLYVLIDMHQDLYGVSFGEGRTTLGDGAPAWATITNDQPHVRGAVWSESYLISPAVQKAFDNFWANTPASDGIGIQDHYARMWQFVAKRFANNKAVIGYDIMNEPFSGTGGTYIVPLMMKAYAEMFAEETGKVLSEKELMTILSDENQKFEALSRLDNQQKYSRFVDAASDLNQEFEKTSLKAMYQYVGNAIREVDSTHILFLEHSYFGNTGMSSGIEPVKTKSGTADPLVAYAAHAYDLLVDTKEYEKTNNARVDVIFNRIHETSERINLPVLVGEWGALSGSSKAMVNAASYITGLFEKYGFGNTYWAYYPGIEKDQYFNTAIVRPYPQYTGGMLKNYGSDNSSGDFKCTWAEAPDVKAPTVIFIPDIDNLDRGSININPTTNKFNIQKDPDSKAGYIIIPVTGDSVERTIGFKQIQNK